MRLAIFGNPVSSSHSELERSLFELMNCLGDEILVEREYYRYLTGQLKWEISCNDIIRDDDFLADAVISIGGDGTFLRAASRVGNKGIPMLGINAGRLGFLADTTEQRAGDAIRMLHLGRYTIEQRALLQISMDSLKEGISPFALNDIALLKHDVSSMISITAKIDGTPLTTYMADGLVIATPTGSTAYSLSVGGPVIAPGTDVIELTPVAPHSLTMRPLIIQGSRVITLTVESRSHNFLVSIDGRSFSCKDGTQIEIRRAPHKISIIKPEGTDFFDTLREKMMWGTDLRQSPIS